MFGSPLEVRVVLAWLTMRLFRKLQEA